MAQACADGTGVRYVQVPVRAQSPRGRECDQILRTYPPCVLGAGCQVLGAAGILECLSGYCGFSMLVGLCGVGVNELRRLARGWAAEATVPVGGGWNTGTTQRHYHPESVDKL